MSPISFPFLKLQPNLEPSDVGPDPDPVSAAALCDVTGRFFRRHTRFKGCACARVFGTHRRITHAHPSQIASIWGPRGCARKPYLAEDLVTDAARLRGISADAVQTRPPAGPCGQLITRLTAKRGWTHTHTLTHERTHTHTQRPLTPNRLRVSMDICRKCEANKTSMTQGSPPNRVPRLESYQLTYVSNSSDRPPSPT